MITEGQRKTFWQYAALLGEPTCREMISTVTRGTTTSTGNLSRFQMSVVLDELKKITGHTDAPPPVPSPIPAPAAVMFDPVDPVDPSILAGIELLRRRAGMQEDAFERFCESLTGGRHITTDADAKTIMQGLNAVIGQKYK